MKVAHLNYESTWELLNQDAVLVFSRSSLHEGQFPKGGIFIGDDEGISLLKDYLNPSQPVILFGDFSLNLAEELAKLPNVVGFTRLTLDVWERHGGALDLILLITTEEFGIDHRLGKPQVIDIRPEEQFALEHLAKADSVPAQVLIHQQEELPSAGFFYLYGENSSVPTTITTMLKRINLHNFYVLEEGLAGLKAAGVSIEP